jgi:hypothetical protein
MTPSHVILLSGVAARGVYATAFDSAEASRGPDKRASVGCVEFDIATFPN